MTKKPKAPVYRPDQLDFAAKHAAVGVAKRAAPKTIGRLMYSNDPIEPVRPAQSNSVKAIADRAAARSVATRSMADRHQQAGATVDVKSLPPPETAEDYCEYAVAWIRGAIDVPTIQRRWNDEIQMRKRLELTRKQTALLTASLDGRCNRIKSGFKG